MPTSSSPTDLANLSLAKIGAQPINSLTDQANPSALACNLNFWQAVLEVSRATRWNCILTTAQLSPVAQTPIAGGTVPPSPATWAPLTTYQANTYLTYGGYYYQVEFTYTSTNNFLNDLTTGALVQTNLPTNAPFFDDCGSQYPSGWAFAYLLPSDFQLLVSLNDHICALVWGGDGSTADYEIMGLTLYCDRSQAVIQYVQRQPDTTRFDSLFVNALTFKLASMISTTLRQDGGGMEAMLLQEYKRALGEARQKNGGEQQARRFNPINSSRFIQAHWGGVNGHIYIPGWLAKMIWGLRE